MSDNKTSLDKMSFVFGLVAGIAIVSVIVLLNQNTGTKAVADVKLEDAQQQPTPTVAPNNNNPNQPEASAVKPISNDDHIRGNKNAKVQLIEYSDFECPFCLQHQSTMQKIAEEFKDKIAIVYRHFPLSFHPEAQKAAEASECADEQGKFWEMHDKIFAANAAGNMSVDQWKKEASNLGLNTDQFNSCLDSGKYAAKIRQDSNEGVAAGVQGTPATFINGQLVSGAVPYEQFKTIIEQVL